MNMKLLSSQENPVGECDGSPNLTDAKTCRAQSSGFADYADCLVKDPTRCAHAFRFGYSYFCQHPERLEIVKRTQIQQNRKRVGS